MAVRNLGLGYSMKMIDWKSCGNLLHLVEVMDVCIWVCVMLPQRKLLDELGIPAEDVPVDQFTPLGRMLYKAPSDGKWGEHELDYLLFIVKDVSVNPNPDEVADIKYVNKEQLKEILRKADAGEEGLKLSLWFRLVVDNFLYKWWYHVEKGTLHKAADMKTIHKL
ncbi:hypothetical protein QQ045_020710 [Rhodiola kirilowii]